MNYTMQCLCDRMQPCDDKGISIDARHAETREKKIEHAVAEPVGVVCLTNVANGVEEGVDDTRIRNAAFVANRSRTVRRRRWQRGTAGRATSR